MAEIDRLVYEWAAFKALLTKKNPNPQYLENADNHAVWFDELSTRYFCAVAKGTADETDFVTNYLAQCNWAVGQRPYAFAAGDYDFSGDGAYDVCVAGGTKDVDYTLTEELYIDGGVIIIENSIVGDWIEVNVVHPVYGVVKTYIKKRYVPASPAGYPTPIMSIKTGYAGKLSANLTLRLTMHSTATSGPDVKVGVNYDLHRAI